MGNQTAANAANAASMTVPTAATSMLGGASSAGGLSGLIGGMGGAAPSAGYVPVAQVGPTIGAASSIVKPSAIGQFFQNPYVQEGLRTPPPPAPQMQPAQSQQFQAQGPSMQWAPLNFQRNMRTRA